MVRFIVLPFTWRQFLILWKPRITVKISLYVKITVLWVQVIGDRFRTIVFDMWMLLWLRKSSIWYKTVISQREIPKQIVTSYSWQRAWLLPSCDTTPVIIRYLASWVHLKTASLQVAADKFRGKVHSRCHTHRTLKLIIHVFHQYFNWFVNVFHVEINNLGFVIFWRQLRFINIMDIILVRRFLVYFNILIF